MSKKHKKRRSVESLDASEVIKKDRFRKNRKYLLLLVANTVLVMSLYAYLVRTPYVQITLWTYMAITLVFASAYIIYNRGFSRRGVTPEMLPDSMTAAEKSDWIADGEARMQKSKWMLTVIFPFVMTFCLDAFIIFVIEPLFSGV